MIFFYIIIVGVICFCLWAIRTLYAKACVEAIQKQFGDVVTFGAIKYFQNQLSDLGCLVSNLYDKNFWPKDRDILEELKKRYADDVLSDIHFYLALVDCFDNSISGSDWTKYFVQTKRGWEIVTNVRSYRFPILIESNLFEKMVITMLFFLYYYNDETRKIGHEMLEQAHPEIKCYVLNLTRHPEFNKLVSYKIKE